jgi:hypothetical protein
MQYDTVAPKDDQEIIIDLGEVQLGVELLDEDSGPEVAFRVIRNGQQLSWDDPVAKSMIGGLQALVMSLNAAMNHAQRHSTAKPLDLGRC